VRKISLKSFVDTRVSQSSFVYRRILSNDHITSSKMNTGKHKISRLIRVQPSDGEKFSQFVFGDPSWSGRIMSIVLTMINSRLRNSGGKNPL